MTHEKYPIFANTEHRATRCRWALARLAYDSSFIALIAIVLIHGGCSERPEGAATQSISREDAPELQRLKIVCTTTMIEDLVRNLAGNAADVSGIMRAGEDPHIYDARPRDAEQIAEADLVFTNGFHLEATLGNIIKNNAQGTVIPLAEKAVRKPLMGNDNSGAPDPHCWMNVDYFRGYLKHVLEALITEDPKNESYYRGNASRYDAQLSELDPWIKNQIASVPKGRRVMVTSHDAFQYFADAYDIEVRAMIGISTAEAPRPQEIEKLEKLIRDRNVQALFFETSVSPTLNTLIQKSAEATGANIGGTLYSDSLDQPSPASGNVSGHDASQHVDHCAGPTRLLIVERKDWPYGF